ncbi:Protein C19orf12-like protein, partial [Frankliniella fusca]
KQACLSGFKDIARQSTKTLSYIESNVVSLVSVPQSSLKVTMPLNTSEVMYILSELAEQKNLRVAVTESLKCGLGVGLSAAICSILLGPIGLAIGGTVSSVMASYMMRGKYKSVALVIAEDMTPLQQEQLAASCMRIIADFRIDDVTILLPLLLNSPSAQQALMTQLVTYVTSQMKLQIID